MLAKKGTVDAENVIERSKGFSWERMAEETIKVYRDIYKAVG